MGGALAQRWWVEESGGGGDGGGGLFDLFLFLSLPESEISALSPGCSSSS